MRKIYFLLTLSIFIFSYCSEEDPPIADFSYESSNGVAPTRIKFTNLSVNADKSHWDFGDGNTSSENSPTNYYTKAGTYNIELIASNDDGENSIIKEIEILQATSYCISNKSSFTLESVLSFYDIESTMYDVQEHGDIRSNARSNEITTNRKKISVIFGFGQNWLLVITPFDIYNNTLNVLSINDDTIVMQVSFKSSPENINLVSFSGSKKIKLGDLVID